MQKLQYEVQKKAEPSTVEPKIGKNIEKLNKNKF